jgi:hypothetical protein
MRVPWLPSHHRPPVPAEPVAPGSRSLFLRAGRAPVLFAALLGIVFGMLVMNQRVLANTTASVVAETAKQIAAQVDTYTISMADIVNVRGRPIRATEETHFGQAVTTSTVNVGGDSTGTGWAEATYAQATAQQIRIVNTHASNSLCLQTIARSASTVTCNTACTAVGAGALTCTGSGAADGTLLLPGAPPFVTTITGLECECAEASAASTGMNAVRLTRSPQ